MREPDTTSQQGPGADSRSTSASKRRKSVVFGAFRFDSQGPMLSKDGAEIRLGPKPLAVLQCLLEQPGEVVTKQQLMDAVWGGTAVTEHSLVQAVKALRKALDDDSDQPTYIETAPWRGYRFIAPVVIVDAEPNGEVVNGVSVNGTITNGLLYNGAAAPGRFGAVGARLNTNPWAMLSVALVLIVAGFLAGAIAMGGAGSGEADSGMFVFRLDFENNELVAASIHTVVDISPNGRHLAFAGIAAKTGQPAVPALYLQEFDERVARPIPGSEQVTSFAFSPDGQQVVFRHFEQRALLRIPTSGGDPITVLDDAAARQPFWGADGWIVYSRDDQQDIAPGIWRIRETGGQPEQLTTVHREEGEGWHQSPRTLPNGAGVLFGVDGMVAVVDLETRQHRELLEGTSARYSTTGHIVFARDGSLFAVAFDQDALQLAGEPLRILDDVLTDNSDSAKYALSDTGTLVYVPGEWPTERHVPFLVDLVAASAEPLFDFPGDFDNPRVSPDGKRVALTSPQAAGRDIWIYEIDGDMLGRLTDSGDVGAPVWSPDGTRVAFGRGSGIYAKTVNDGSEPVLLLEWEQGIWPMDWSSDNVLAFGATGSDSRPDIWLVRIEGSRADEPELWQGTDFWDWDARFSPDGRHIVHLSRQTGRHEVYVREVANPDHYLKISNQPGHAASVLWSRDGDTIYYRTRTSADVRTGPKYYAVGIETEPELSAERPRLLGELRNPPPPREIMPDGRHFLSMDTVREGTVDNELTVILNWATTLSTRPAPGR